MFADPVSAFQWPPVLLLTDLYLQALLTMGAGEFFSSSSFSTSSSRAMRTPLTLVILMLFSKWLLNIAFTMYWCDDQSIMHGMYVSSQVRCSWEMVREKATKRLLGIHARVSSVHLFLSNSSAHGRVKFRRRGGIAPR